MNGFKCSFSNTTSNACVLPRATDLGEERNLKVNAIWILNFKEAK